jgi:hypothetical protein
MCQLVRQRAERPGKHLGHIHFLVVAEHDNRLFVELRQLSLLVNFEITIQSLAR